LTEPNAYVRDPDARREARFVVALILAGACVMATLALLSVIHPLLRPQLPLNLISSLILFCLYASTRYFNPVRLVPFVSISGLVAILVVAVYYQGEAGASVLYFLIAITFFSSLSLKPAQVVLLILLQLAATLMAPVYIVGVAFDNVLRPFTFLLTMNLLYLLVVQYRRRLEKERRAELAASEQRYKLISNMMSDYAFSTRINPDGQWEREWMTDSFKRFTGYDDAGAFLTGPNLFHPDDQDRLNMDVERVLKGERFTSDYRIVTASGEVRWMQIERIPEQDPTSQRVIRYYGIAHDITERRLAEDTRLKQALEQERMGLVRRFIEGVSHDFRTTISQIETSRYLIDRLLPSDLSNRADIEEKMRRIQQAITHMTSQLESFETIGSLAYMTFYPLDVNQLIKDIHTTQEHHAIRRGLKLSLAMDLDLPLIDGNPKELSRALLHLVNNALTHTPKGGTIRLRSRRGKGVVAIDVQDTGKGIPADQIKYIFDFFYRVDSARSIELGGVGLGLSIVRMIVEAHRGRIEVQSAVGEGTTFTLVFPQRPPSTVRRLNSQAVPNQP